MKSNAKIASDVRKIKSAAGKATRRKGETVRQFKARKAKSIDYAALRKSLKGIANVPSGRLTPQKKGALVRTAKRVAEAAAGTGIPVRVSSGAKRRALAALNGKSSRDAVQFVQGRDGEKFRWYKRGGKPVVGLYNPSQGTRRVFMPYDKFAFSLDPRAEIMRVAAGMKGDAVMGAAGRYVYGQKVGQGGREFADDDIDGLVEKVIEYVKIDGGNDPMAEFSLDAANDVSEWAVGIWDVYDPNPFG